jgi:hypothetical protein
MLHPVFGEIAWLAGMGWWTGRVPIPFFAGYDTDAAAACAAKLGVANWQKAPNDRHRHGDFDLNLVCADGGNPTAAQERAFRHFRDNEDLICNRVLDAIFALYQGTWASYRGTADPGTGDDSVEELRIPELHARDELRRVIRLEFLTLADIPQTDVALLGFCFACTWDGEHGLGVLVRAGNVLEVGENDITWSAPEFAGKRGAMWMPTRQQIDEQHGIAAIKKLGGAEKLDRVKQGEPLYVTQVDLCRNTQVNDADLKPLRLFPELRQLELASPLVTDAGLRELGELKGLQTLQLTGAGITDAGLGELRKLNLKVLRLTGTPITDDGLRELRDHAALAVLHLSDTRVTDNGLKELRALKSLQHLELANTGVTDAGIRELKELVGLLALDVSGTAITDAGLRELQDCTSLRYLTLNRTRVTDQGLKHLQQMKGLRSLKLQSTATTDAGVAELQNAIPRLQVAK